MSGCTSFTEAEFYQSNFDPRAYVRNFHSSPRGHEDENNFLAFVLKSLSETFSTGKHRGQRLIDVGSGPNIHTVISACEYYDEIVLSDFVDNSRGEIEKWLRNEEGCIDWKPVVEYICELEGKSTSDVETKLRQRIKRVLKCDVRLENPFFPQTLEPADCVITSLCLEAASKDIDTYRCALTGLSKLLRPGGLLVMIGVLGETFYRVDEQLFSCLPLSESTVRVTIESLGFIIEMFTIDPAEDPKSNTVSDFEAVFYLVARKPSD